MYEERKQSVARLASGPLHEQGASSSASAVGEDVDKTGFEPQQPIGMAGAGAQQVRAAAEVELQPENSRRPGRNCRVGVSF